VAEVVIAIGAQRAGDALARRQQHVHLRGWGASETSSGHRDQVVGRLAAPTAPRPRGGRFALVDMSPAARLMAPRRPPDVPPNFITTRRTSSAGYCAADGARAFAAVVSVAALKTERRRRRPASVTLVGVLQVQRPESTGQARDRELRGARAQLLAM